MRIVQRQPEDEMPKCEVIFERALKSTEKSHGRVISIGRMQRISRGIKAENFRLLMAGKGQDGRRGGSIFIQFYIKSQRGD